MLDISNCRCIIFDLDGTILDSTQVWAKVDMDFLGRRGIPVSKEYMQEIKTHTFESGSVYTKEKYNLPESTEEIMKEWYDAACKAYTDKVVLKPYAKTFIEQMALRLYRQHHQTGRFLSHALEEMEYMIFLMHLHRQMKCREERNSRMYI